MFNVIENRRWAWIVSGILAALSIAALVFSLVKTEPLSDADAASVQGQAVLIAIPIVAVATWWALHGARRSFRYGVCALLGVLHDLLVTCGFYALMTIVADWTVDGLFFVAALCTIVFSAQSLITAFDRVRENEARKRAETYQETIKRSIAGALLHSLPVRLSLFLGLLALLLLGGETFTPLAATLLVGLAITTYSAVFFTTPLVAAWNGER